MCTPPEHSRCHRPTANAAVCPIDVHQQIDFDDNWGEMSAPRHSLQRWPRRVLVQLMISLCH